MKVLEDLNDIEVIGVDAMKHYGVDVQFLDFGYIHIYFVIYNTLHVADPPDLIEQDHLGLQVVLRAHIDQWLRI